MNSFEDKYKQFKKPVSVPANYADLLQSKLNKKLFYKRMKSWSLIPLSMAASVLIAVLVLNYIKDDATIVSVPVNNIESIEVKDSALMNDIWLEDSDQAFIENSNTQVLKDQVFEETTFSDEFIFEYFSDENLIDL